MIHFNLSNLKYSKVQSPEGPVQKINIVKYKNHFDEPVYEAYVHLQDRHKMSLDLKSSIYGASDGTGTSRSKIQAIYKGISESLERWAYYYSIEHGAENCGLQFDSTTTGFAALPCWPSGAVRTIAWLEAAERWAITNWWNGKLNINTQENIINSVESRNIVTPFSGLTVNLLSEKVSLDSSKLSYVYGFAAGWTQNEAFEKALVELKRNKRALLISSLGNKQEAHCITDLRFLFFASTQGHDLFLERCLQQAVHTVTTPPKLIVDIAIDGPWQKYTNVWRCLFENTDTNLDKLEFFLF